MSAGTGLLRGVNPHAGPWVMADDERGRRVLVRPDGWCAPAEWRESLDLALRAAYVEAARALDETGKRHAVVVTTQVYIGPGTGVVFAVVPTGDRRGRPLCYLAETRAPRLAGYALRTAETDGDVDPRVGRARVDGWARPGDGPLRSSPFGPRRRSVHGRPR